MIEKLLKEVDDVSVQVIFTTPPDIADTKYAPTRHFLAISAVAGENQDQIDLALDDWYRSADKNYEAFAKRNPVKDLENTVYKMEIQAMNERCQTVGVKATPTIFINGNQMPPLYRIDELAYILSD